jgi:transcriptional regulator with XRE-family HTH domain
MERIVHQGRNIKRFREMLGIKQEALAIELGEDWNQGMISVLEQKEEVEAELLERIAKYFKVPVESIRNFDEQMAINIISNTFSDFKDNAQASIVNYHYNFNPMEKWLEALEEIKRLQAALVEEKDGRIELLERMVNKKY